jgi:hypothetical protein
LTLLTVAQTLDLCRTDWNLSHRKGDPRGRPWGEGRVIFRSATLSGSQSVTSDVSVGRYERKSI